MEAVLPNSPEPISAVILSPPLTTASTIGANIYKIIEMLDRKHYICVFQSVR